MKYIKFLLIIFFLSLVFLPEVSVLAQGIDLSDPGFQGIVPCGTDATGPCTLCHLIVGIQRLIRYGLYLVTTMAFVGIFIGVSMYLISGGSEDLVKSAKSFIGASVKGFAIVLGAWLIINTLFWIIPRKQDYGIGKSNWFSLACDTISSTGNLAANDTGKSPIAAVVGDNSRLVCGDSDRGKCFTNTGGICPNGYRSLDGGTKSCSAKNLSEGITKCCIADADVTVQEAGKTVEKCGENFRGTCMKTTFYICPSGWEALGGGASCSTAKTTGGGAKCCIQSKSSALTLGQECIFTKNAGGNVLGTCQKPSNNGLCSNGSYAAIAGQGRSYTPDCAAGLGCCQK